MMAAQHRANTCKSFEAMAVGLITIQVLLHGKGLHALRTEVCYSWQVFDCARATCSLITSTTDRSLIPCRHWKKIKTQWFPDAICIFLWRPFSSLQCFSFSEDHYFGFCSCDDQLEDCRPDSYFLQMGWGPIRFLRCIPRRTLLWEQCPL